MRTFTFTDAELKLILEGLETIASNYTTSDEQQKPHLDLSARLRFPAAETFAAEIESDTFKESANDEDVDTFSDAYGWKKPKA